MTKRKCLCQLCNTWAALGSDGQDTVSACTCRNVTSALACKVYYGCIAVIINTDGEFNVAVPFVCSVAVV